MNSRWTFRAVCTGSSNVIEDWLAQNTQLRARIDSYLRRLREMELPWPYTYYRPLGDGIGEIRVDFGKVEHRLYGFFGMLPGEFTVLIAASGKGKQQKLIQEAKKLKKQMEISPFATEEYFV